MSASPGHLILALHDLGLRSMLAAQLSMAGEMPISTTNHLDQTLGQRMRATSMLVIEHSLIASAARDWVQTLRNQDWTGPIIIIVDEMPDDGQRDEMVTLVEKRNPGAAILALVRRWHSQKR